jgi:hypothetical protein
MKNIFRSLIISLVRVLSNLDRRCGFIVVFVILLYIRWRIHRYLLWLFLDLFLSYAIIISPNITDVALASLKVQSLAITVYDQQTVNDTDL